MAMVVAAALGPADKDKPPTKVGDPGVKDLAAGYGSAEEAIAAINRAMTI